jgi:hypothetical protein
MRKMRFFIDHAYSTNEDTEIGNYTREPTPLCYVWGAKTEAEENVVKMDNITTIATAITAG